MPRDNGKEGFTVHADAWLVTVIDREAARLDLNRSQFCVRAIKKYIGYHHADSVCKSLSKKYESKSK